ncbi:MAG: DUF4337 domain-containing protein [Pseudomonadota bacterium]
MMFNLIVFILLVLLLCGGIWSWVRKNAKPPAERHVHHYQPESLAIPLKKDQPPEKLSPQPAAPAASPNLPAGHPTENHRWHDWLALTTTIIALIAVISSLEATRSSMMAVILSGKEGSQWLMYQAKGIKEYSYQITKSALELQLAGNQDMSAEGAEKYRQAIKKYDEELKRYKDEKDELMQEGLSLAKTKEKNQKRAAGLNASLAFLMMAILLSAIATLMRKKYIWYTGLSMVIGWLYFFILNF